MRPSGYCRDSRPGRPIRVSVTPFVNKVFRLARNSGIRGTPLWCVFRSEGAAAPTGTLFGLGATHRISRQASLRLGVLNASASAGRRRDCVFHTRRRRNYRFTGSRTIYERISQTPSRQGARFCADADDALLSRRTVEAGGFCPSAIARLSCQARASPRRSVNRNYPVEICGPRLANSRLTMQDKCND